MKKPRRSVIKDKKLRGEWAESVFMARAGEHGLPVSRPWGEMHSYDFVIGNTGRFASVQVKSTIMQAEGGYVCTLRSGERRYPPGSFDFVAAYVVLEDIWYIIPSELVEGKKIITLYPRTPDAKYEQYREAWHLLRQASGSVEPVKTDQPVKTGDAVSVADPASVVPPAAHAEPMPMGPAIVRMRNAFDFMRRHFERGGVVPQKLPSDVDSG